MDFDVEKISSKMMVVSLLTIVIKLSPFYQGSGESFVSPPMDTMNDYIQACCEAWKIIELVENSDPKAVLVNKQANKLFQGLKESLRWLGLALPVNKYQARTELTIQMTKRSLQVLTEKGEKTTITSDESMNWKEVIESNNLYKLCESMTNLSINLEEMLDAIQSSLANVIGSCMFKMGEIRSSSNTA